MSLYREQLRETKLFWITICHDLTYPKYGWIFADIQKAGLPKRQAKLPLLLTPLTYIIHMDVVNADIAGANICPCRQKKCG